MTEEHPAFISQWLPDGATLGRSWVVAGCWFLAFTFIFCPVAFGSTVDATNVKISISLPAIADQNARELYNAGTLKLRAGKLDDAEMLLQSSIVKQNAAVQPVALFNLGYVRFAQGNEELKKSPSGEAATRRSQVATQAGVDAIQNAENALAGNDVQQMMQAYFAGRGVRKEMRAAMTMVQRAMEAYGKTLTKWQRSLNDFKSAAELNPADTNAVRNVEIVQQAIAKLVDSLREMQQSTAGLGQKQKQLGELLKQLKGQIPAPNMPPGAPGDDGDEDDGGEKPMPESLAGQEETANSGGGQEMELKISPEKAGQLLNGIQPDGKLLPSGQGDSGKPKDRSGRNW